MALASLFPKAATLDLRGCHELGPALPLGISRFSELKKLCISGCPKLTALPWTLGRIGSLVELDVDAQSLPETLGELCNLKDLSSSCDVPLPESLGRLSKLEKLYIGCCNLLALPESLGNLSLLKELFCEEVSLLTLPNSLSGLTNLVRLELYDCDSLKLPESVRGLVNLTYLDFMNYDSSKDPAGVPDGIWDLVNLKELDLSGNLGEAPEALGNLSNLRSLFFCSCLFAALPDSLGQLGLLEVLDLGTCKSLATLPETVGNLRNLKTLDLNGCEALATLPTSFSGLEALTSLNISRCTSLRDLPLAVWMLGLKCLNVSGCNLAAGGLKLIANQ